MPPFVFCGIDPGITGAIAFYRPKDGALMIYDMPTRPRANGRREVCPNVTAAYLSKFFPRYRGICVIEKVAAMTGREDSASSFQFGRSFGICLGALAGVNISALEVRPAVWKGKMNLTRNKRDSLELACKTFPRHKKYFTRVKDNGRAEAALLAFFGQEIWDLELDEE